MKTCCDTLHVHEDKVIRIQSTMLKEGKLQRVSHLFKTLCDPTRINILYALKDEELCVCDLSVIVGMTQSAMSHQLKCLRDADLVRYRKEGKVVFYRLADHHVHRIFNQALDHVSEQHEEDL